MSTIRVIIVYVTTICMAIIVSGCSGASQRGFAVRNLYGDLLIRDVASDAQQYGPGTRIDADTLPVGELSPVSVDADLRGLLSVASVRIENVTGNIVIERALTGTQGVDIVRALRALYRDGGDPFGSWEYSYEETE